MSGRAALSTVWQVCAHCQGSGGRRVIAPASLRQSREKAGLSLRQVAVPAGLSAMYLCDVERGRRNVTERVLDAYTVALRRIP